MEQKAPNPIEWLDQAGATPLVQAYFELCYLKHLYRQGWLRRGVPPERCESVADHSFGVTVLALWLARASFPTLDADKAVRMALLHELGEIYAGDITPRDGIPLEEKRRREADSVQRVCSKLPGGDEYIALWEEFERGDTPEALFVRQLDRLEMGLQAAVYERAGLAQLPEFFASARAALTDETLARLIDEVERRLPGDLA
ncbi:MAG: HD domain-containing protein [Chloroflexota bacterium]